MRRLFFPSLIAAFAAMSSGHAQADPARVPSPAMVRRFDGLHDSNDQQITVGRERLWLTSSHVSSPGSNSLDVEAFSVDAAGAVTELVRPLRPRLDALMIQAGQDPAQCSPSPFASCALQLAGWLPPPGTSNLFELGARELWVTDGTASGTRSLLTGTPLGTVQSITPAGIGWAALMDGQWLRISSAGVASPRSAGDDSITKLFVCENRVIATTQIGVPHTMGGVIFEDRLFSKVWMADASDTFVPVFPEGTLADRVECGLGHALVTEAVPGGPPEDRAGIITYQDWGVPLSGAPTPILSSAATQRAWGQEWRAGGNRMSGRPVRHVGAVDLYVGESITTPGEQTLVTGDGTPLWPKAAEGIRHGVQVLGQLGARVLFGTRVDLVQSTYPYAGTFRSELWSTDGTPAGTVKLRDLPFVAIPNADDGLRGSALSDRPVGEAPAYDHGWLAFSTKAFSPSASDPGATDNDFRVWVTDGTAAGTREVAAYPPGRNSRAFSKQNVLLFLKNTVFWFELHPADDGVATLEALDLAAPAPSTAADGGPDGRSASGGDGGGAPGASPGAEEPAAEPGAAGPGASSSGGGCALAPPRTAAAGSVCVALAALAFMRRRRR